MDEELRNKLRARYKDMHPLMLLRTLERARSPGDAFDILEDFAKVYPASWDEESRRWVTTDLFGEPIG